MQVLVMLAKGKICLAMHQSRRRVLRINRALQKVYFPIMMVKITRAKLHSLVNNH